MIGTYLTVLFFFFFFDKSLGFISFRTEIAPLCESCNDSQFCSKRGRDFGLQQRTGLGKSKTFSLTTVDPHLKATFTILSSAITIPIRRILSFLPLLVPWYGSLLSSMSQGTFATRPLAPQRNCSSSTLVSCQDSSRVV